MRLLERRLPPPLLLAALAGAMWAARASPPTTELDDGARAGLAAGMAALGALINALGFIALRRAGTTFDPTRPEAACALVTSGIFRRSRNPMYLGFTLLLSGWALYLPSAWTSLGPLLFVLWVDRLQIAPEERALRAKFGADFEAYRRRVRRWV